MAETQQAQAAPAAHLPEGSKDIPSFLPLTFDPNLLGPPGAGHQPAARQQQPQQHFGSMVRQPLGHMARGPPGTLPHNQPHLQQQMAGGFGGMPPGQLGMPSMLPGMMHPQQMQQVAPGTAMPPVLQHAAGPGWPGAPAGLPPLPPVEPCDPLSAANGGMYPAAAANKRRRRDAPPLDAEAQLLLLGFLSAVVADSTTLSQCLVSAVGLEAQQEQQRRAAAAAGIAAAMPPPPKLGVLGSYKLAQKLAAELRARPALSLVYQLQLTLDAARSMLALGGAVGLDDVRTHVLSDLTSLLGSMDNEALPARRAKVEAQCEMFTDALKDVAEQLLQESGHIEKPAAPAARTITVYKPLPRCIIENKEPFAHKEWRREPFDPRPYTPLTEYAITTNVPAEAKALRWKLSTRRADGAGDGFSEKHSELTADELKDKETHLVKQVVARQALIQGVDVVEVDTWGMDCYTRRNVFDAVLEADVFKHLRPEQEEFEPDPELDAREAQQQLDAAQQSSRPKRKKRKKKQFKESHRGGSSAAAAARQPSAAGGGGPLRPPPQVVLDNPEIPVLCNTTPGTFLLLEMRVLCLCDACSMEPDLESRKFMPTKFEQHAGAGSSKKWRASIRIPPGAVDQCPPDAQPMQVGKWMDEMGIDSKVPKAGPAWLLTTPGQEQQQQQQEGGQQQQQQQQPDQQGHGQPEQLQQLQQGQQMPAAADTAQPMEVDGQQQQQPKQQEPPSDEQQQQQPAVKAEADIAAAAAAASSPQQPGVKLEAVETDAQQQQQPVKSEQPAAAETMVAEQQEQQQQQQQEPHQPIEQQQAPAATTGVTQEAGSSVQPNAQPLEVQQHPQQQQQQQLSDQQRQPSSPAQPGSQPVQQPQQSSPGQQSREASTNPPAAAAAESPGAAADAAGAADGSTEGGGATGAGAAAVVAAAAAAAGEVSSSGDEVSGSDESSDDEDEGGVRRSSRSRKKVVYADDAAVQLEATTAAAREAAREAARDRLYGTRRIKYGDEEKDAVHAWIDAVFIPAVNRAGHDGWDMVKVATDIKLAAEAQGHETDVKAAAAILRQFERLPEGYNYFRLHPKGRGMLVARPDGIQPFTFVEEYLGEVHTGWRWFEVQDAIKKITQKELPDFYNITLERPKDDPDGYDVMFVDAAFMGSFASRMSHSCSPNCQAVVVSAGGRLTVALYTIRHVLPGEELTFDYASVTESEDEFKQAFCMCSSRSCRGSYLHYTGKAYMQVIEEQHTFLDRQVALLRCSREALTDDDKAALHAAGLRGSALGRGDVAANPEVPDWLKKWAALTLQFVHKEKELLPAALQALPHPLTVSEPDSVSAAVGVELNRLQNICITLDKAKHCLNQPGQCREAPLVMLTDAEAAEHLWSGDKSVAKRAAAATAVFALEPQHAELLISARSPQQYAAVGEALSAVCAPLAAIATLLGQPAADADSARALLGQMVGHLRDLDVAQGGGHTRAADVLALYAATQVWFTSTRDYISFSSPPLQLHDDMINMHGGFAGTMGPPRRTSSQEQMQPAAGAAGGSNGFAPGGFSSYPGSTVEGWAPPADWEAAGPQGGAAGGGEREREREGGSSRGGRGGRGGSRAGSAGSSYKRGADSDDEYDPDNDSFSGSSPGSSEVDSDDSSRPRRSARGGGRGGRGRGRGRLGGGGGGGGGALSLRDISRKVLEKRYGPLYVWAQLSSWYKQTVYDPTASLSAERRGTLSLPDIEACYNTKEKYDTRERSKLLSHIASQPERQWTSSCWSFKNEAKVYGSPMFDALWFEVLKGVPRSTPLEQLAESLRAATVPTGGAGGLGRGGGRAGRGRGGGRGRGVRGRGGRPGGRGGRRRTASADGSSSDEGGMDFEDGSDGMGADYGAAAAAAYGAMAYGQYPGYLPGQQWQQ